MSLKGWDLLVAFGKWREAERRGTKSQWLGGRSAEGWAQRGGKGWGSK